MQVRRSVVIVVASAAVCQRSGVVVLLGRVFLVAVQVTLSAEESGQRLGLRIRLVFAGESKALGLDCSLAHSVVLHVKINPKSQFVLPGQGGV